MNLNLPILSTLSVIYQNKFSHHFSSTSKGCYIFQNNSFYINIQFLTDLYLVFGIIQSKMSSFIFIFPGYVQSWPKELLIPFVVQSQRLADFTPTKCGL